ncbi:condensation domain-containing protein, partial [Streptomyces hyaluromycini]
FVSFFQWCSLPCSGESGAPDVVVGTPVSGRGDAELDGLVAPLVNVLPLRFQVSAGQSFAGFLAQARARVQEAVGHRSVTPPDFAALSRRHTRVGLLGLCRTILVVDEATHNGPALPGATVRRVPVETGASKVDLCFTLLHADGEFDGTLDYLADRYSATEAERIVHAFTALLAELAGDTGRPVSSA